MGTELGRFWWPDATLGGPVQNHDPTADQLQHGLLLEP